MNRFLPSKKLSVFLVLTLVILGCFFVFYKYGNRKVSYLLNPEKQKVTENTTNKIVQQTIKTDTDGDGLKDWEETLWKTDPTNPDTDGDGTNDNDEILTNRNPLIAGPNDLLDDKITLLNKEIINSLSNEPLTQTDLLSRELFAGYIALKQENQLGTDQEKQLIDNLITKNLLTTTESIKSYTLNDLNIIHDNSKEITQQYATQTYLILSSNIEMKNDIVIVKEILETRNKQKLQEIDLNIEIYKNIQKELLSLPTPYEISTPHINAINALGGLISNTTQMKQILNDPIAGLLNIKKYMTNQEIFEEEWKKIGLYLFEKGIKFI